jgi:TM2 domain-containing membrane protein YozV
MNPAIKAALFSALLFPGWGQIYLKKYQRGIMIILPVFAGIVAITWAVLQIAITVIKASPLKRGEVDISAVLKLTNDSIKALDPYYLSFIVLLIIFLWAFSIVDAYLLGKKEISVSNIDADQESACPPVE